MIPGVPNVKKDKEEPTKHRRKNQWEGSGKTRSDETHSNWNKGNNKTTAEINNIGNKKTLENNQ